MKKRLLAFALCVVMVIAMAVPAFAEKAVAPGSKVVPRSNISDIHGWGLTLDQVNFFTMAVSGGVASQNQNVILAVPAVVTAQHWYYEYDADRNYRLKTAINKNYALNIYRYNSNLYNCDIMQWSSNMTDSALQYPSTSPTGGARYIYLANYPMMLGASQLAVGGDIRWFSNPTYQAWWIL